MTVLCDLDGVIYRGRRILEGVPEAMQRLVDAGEQVYFITNNSTRTPSQGAAKISDLTGISVDPNQVLGSSLAAAGMLGSEDGPVLVVGEAGVADAVRRAGLDETTDPMAARSVLVGLTRAITYEVIGEAMAAVRNGARFIATNADNTFPTETGLLPGAGSIVAAISAASGVDPEIAGKPHPPMRQLIRSRGVGAAWVIGDRVDTDIALAADIADWTSILVLTGVTGPDEAERSDAGHVVADFPAAVDVVLGDDSRS